MTRKIGEHFDANGILETWHEDGEGNLTIQRSQDAQTALDLVAAANRDGVRTEDGLGRPIAEVPLLAAADYALARGILPEKLLYSNEYDDVFMSFIAEHQKLQYRAASKLFVMP